MLWSSTPHWVLLVSVNLSTRRSKNSSPVECIRLSNLWPACWLLIAAVGNPAASLSGTNARKNLKDSACRQFEAHNVYLFAAHTWMPNCVYVPLPPHVCGNFLERCTHTHTDGTFEVVSCSCIPPFAFVSVCALPRPTDTSALHMPIEKY